MSLFKKLAASAGIGAAKVNTILEKNEYLPGEKVNGSVLVKGGNTEQHIRYIELLLETEYAIVKDDKKEWKTVTMESRRVTESFTISPGKERRFPFSFIMPLDAPMTMKGTRVFLLTDLDIQGGIDKSDEDPIAVKPHPWIKSVLEAMGDLGFRLQEADCEHAPYFNRRMPFVQEFEFVPVSQNYRRLFDELELVFLLEDNGLDVIIEVDRRARGLRGWLEEMYNEGEKLVRVRFDESQLKNREELKTSLQAIIEQYAG
ncbi:MULTISPECIES: sporulation protein [Bacillus]|uniref:Sporulation protein n=1 Tax=Bacillus glycinifermentans TaxID=1664069 RepID=A0AAJ3YVY2_9BACI|nr:MULTISPECIES: sporulation protein [Bacillus]KKB71587.1 sporulation protein [Bacillus sp. TH008]MDU0071780.1 sporulation protein [Bacillus sp. IG6]MED8019941.1 sporulation protein [Bacillus glycinifermentans]NUJ17985.1 sporulation protein [Bacillus glycinifermentans]QAT64352.1 sporulation protein [Bacillus glycinifermentans]